MHMCESARSVFNIRAYWFISNIMNIIVGAHQAADQTHSHECTMNAMHIPKFEMSESVIWECTEPF